MEIDMSKVVDSFRLYAQAALTHVEHIQLNKSLKGFAMLCSSRDVPQYYQICVLLNLWASP